MASITTHPYFIAIVCNLMMIDCGFIEFTTYYESWRTLSRSQIPMKLWVTYLGVVIGALVSVFMIDKLGRKSTLLLTALPKTLGWLLYTLSAELPRNLIVGQIATGIGCGMVYVALPIYLCEITSPNNRGSIGILMSVFFNMGPLLNVLFKKNPYWNEAFLTVILPIVYSMCHKWMFESPEFFAKMLEGGLAKKTLEYILRKENVEEEVQELMNRVNVTTGQDSSLKNSFKALFGKSENRKALRMAIILISGMNLIGWFPVHKIISQTDGSIKLLINPWIIATSILSGIGSMILLPKLKKRYILCASYFLILVILIVNLIGMEQFLKSTRKNHSLDKQYVWGSLPCRLIYTFGCGFALNSIPFVYIGEIFSSDVKPLGVVICIIFYAITKPTFLICSMFIRTQISVPAYGLYEIATTIVLIGLNSICILETEGKSLFRIQRDSRF